MAKKTGLSAKLKAYREGAKLSQEELAGRSGVSRRAIQDIERGINSPSVATMEALAGALGVSIVTFFQDEEGSRKNSKPQRGHTIAQIASELNRYAKIPSDILDALASWDEDWDIFYRALEISPQAKEKVR